MNIEYRDITELIFNDFNPRKIDKKKINQLKKSILEFPEMLKLRPIVVDETMMVLGGNMRLKACQELNITSIPVVQVSDLTEEQKKEFIIKDNISYGDWDWEIIQAEYDVELVEDWGLDIDGFDLAPDDFSDEFSLPDGAKKPFMNICYDLSNEQVEFIKNAIEDAKNTEEFKWIETFGNTNKNGNGLYLIVQQWVEQRK